MDGDGTEKEAWNWDSEALARMFLQCYRKSAEKLTREQAQYATREELLWAYKRLLTYIDRSYAYMDRMLDYIDRMSKMMGQLSAEICRLKEKGGEEETEGSDVP